MWEFIHDQVGIMAPSVTYGKEAPGEILRATNVGYMMIALIYPKLLVSFNSIYCDSV